MSPVLWGKVLPVTSFSGGCDPPFDLPSQACPSLRFSRGGPLLGISHLLYGAALERGQKAAHAQEGWIPMRCPPNLSTARTSSQGALTPCSVIAEIWGC